MYLFKTNYNLIFLGNIVLHTLGKNILLNQYIVNQIRSIWNNNQFGKNIAKKYYLWETFESGIILSKFILLFPEIKKKVGILHNI